MQQLERSLRAAMKSPRTTKKISHASMKIPCAAAKTRHSQKNRKKERKREREREGGREGGRKEGR